MADRATHGWKAANGRRERLLTLAAVGAVHLGLLLLLLTASPARLQRLAEQPMQLITLHQPPPPPAQVLPGPKPAATAKAARAAPAPRPRASPRKRPAPVPVAVAAVADVSLGGSIGSNSLGPLGAGIDLGGGPGAGGGGELSRHAEWIGGSITDRDYPEAAKRAGLQGVVDVRVIVMTNGRARDCRVDHSSGSAELDRMTCALVEQRLLFSPALDAAGKPFEEVSGRRFRYVATRRPR
ncbi:MAG: energy transducer TonB [Sphingomicrobium sp.]